MSFGQKYVDWEERINIERMRKQRLERARSAAKEHGLGALLLIVVENVRYTTLLSVTPHSRGVNGEFYALVPVDSDPVTFDQGMSWPHTKKANPLLDVRYSIPAFGTFGPTAILHPEGVELQLKKFANQIKDALKERGLSKDVLGMDAYNRLAVSALEKAGIKVSIDGGAAMREARMIKTRDEVECLRMAGTICDAMYGRAKEVIRPGMTEVQVKAETARQGYLAGAEFIPGPTVRSGPRTWPILAQTTDRAIRPGDLVIVSTCGTVYLGYNSCHYRNFKCGRPTQQERDAYEKVRDWTWDAIRATKPGVTTKDLAEKYPRAEEFGWPDEDAAIMMQWGHSIGLNSTEAPHISRMHSIDYPVKIKKDMCLAFETIGSTGVKGPYSPYKQGVRIEEMVHVTETGTELLCEWPSDEITACEF